MAAQRQLVKEESALGNDSDNCFLGLLGQESSAGGRTRRDNGHEEEMKDLEVYEKRNNQHVVYTGENIKAAIFPSVTSVHPASPATLPTNPTEARSSLCLNPTQPLCPLRSTMELGRILEPGYLGSSGQWDMMRPQKGSISRDLSSGSSMCQLHSKPTGQKTLEIPAEQEHLGEAYKPRPVAHPEWVSSHSTASKAVETAAAGEAGAPWRREEAARGGVTSAPGGREGLGPRGCEPHGSAAGERGGRVPTV
ncbi:hypothetical protein AB1E18_002378 [Capra hircus]